MQWKEENITELLIDWSNGDKTAEDKLMSLVENELRSIANRRLGSERPDHTLQATALINEVYLRLVNQKNVRWQNRAHFFAIAAQFMRRILIDYARTQNRSKRGGKQQKVTLSKIMGMAQDQDLDLIALDDALNSLAAIDPQKCKIVELRFFGGLTIEETAEILKISSDKVKDEWAVIKAWLYREIKRGK
jgi:RNA polymerase sigma factor (TIGR02999 family)